MLDEVLVEKIISIVENDDKSIKAKKSFIDNIAKQLKALAKNKFVRIGAAGILLWLVKKHIMKDDIQRENLTNYATKLFEDLSPRKSARQFKVGTSVMSTQYVHLASGSLNYEPLHGFVTAIEPIPEYDDAVYYIKDQYGMSYASFPGDMKEDTSTNTTANIPHVNKKMSLKKRYDNIISST